jgi:hypothetical protein
LRKTRVSLFLFLLTAAACAQDANPGRPTVATPATLTPTGYVQFETGVLGSENSPGLANQFGVNEVIKFAPTSRLEFIVQNQPFVHTDLGPARTNDPDDVSLGLQAVLLPGNEKRPTIAVSYFHRVYEGTAPDLDIGSNSQSAIFLVSTDKLGFHIDANAMFTEQIENAVRRAQFGQTLSLAHGLPHKLGLGGELWHFTQPFLNGNAVGFLFGPTYTPKKNLVFDVGFNRGLTSTSTRWEVFAGFTYLLPKKLL